MTQTKIYLTNLQCQKLQNIVGQGFASPYQVLISESDYVGIAGEICAPGISQASNQVFQTLSTHNPGSWLQRILHSVGISKG